MGAILDKIRSKLEACKKQQVQEESKQSGPLLLGECHSSGSKLYAFYISDVEGYASETGRRPKFGADTKGVIAYSTDKDSINCSRYLEFGEENAKRINEFAFSNDFLRKECLVEAAQDALDRWSRNEREVMTSFYKLEEKYNLKRMKYALITAKHKVLGD